SFSMKASILAVCFFTPSSDTGVRFSNGSLLKRVSSTKRLRQSLQIAKWLSSSARMRGEGLPSEYVRIRASSGHCGAGRPAFKPASGFSPLNKRYNGSINLIGIYNQLHNGLSVTLLSDAN